MANVTSKKAPTVGVAGRLRPHERGGEKRVRKAIGLVGLGLLLTLLPALGQGQSPTKGRPADAEGQERTEAGYPKSDGRKGTAAVKQTNDERKDPMEAPGDESSPASAAPPIPSPTKGDGGSNTSGMATGGPVSGSGNLSGRPAQSGPGNGRIPEGGRISELIEQDSDGYRVGIGDVLQINVWREPEVSVPAVTVRSDGRISMPLIKELQVLGLTPAELEWLLTEALSRFLHSPNVTVIVQQINSEKVYLVGGVNTPGAIPLGAPMTVLQVLAQAGGVTDFAKKNKIYILRKEGDKQVRLPFNYDAVIKGKNPDQNVQVRQGDTIVVPQ